MSFFDKIKDIVSAADDEEEYEDTAPRQKRESTKEDTYSSSVNSYEREKTTQFPSDRRNARTQSQPQRIGSQIQGALAKPERFEDAMTVADHLADKRTVVLNLESAPQEIRRRLIDFLSGAAYAHGGKLKRVANNTYIVTPSNVDVMGELLLDEMESGSSYMF